MTKMTITPH